MWSKERFSIIKTTMCLICVSRSRSRSTAIGPPLSAFWIDDPGDVRIRVQGQVQEQDHDPGRDHVGDEPAEQGPERERPGALLQPAFQVADAAKEGREGNVSAKGEGDDPGDDEPKQSQQSVEDVGRVVVMAVVPP